MAVTLKDIADYVGTSVATVSKVLANKTIRVSPQTRTRVLEAAEILNYMPNAAGVNLRRGCTDTIAVIVGDLLYPYYAKLLKEISHLLRARGKSVVVCDIDNNFEIEKEHYLRLKTGYVDGAVLIPSPTTLTQENLRTINGILATVNLPLVVIFGCGETRFPKFSTVGTDPFQSAFAATDYLLSLGHRKIAYVSEMSDDSAVNLKLKGYRAALEKHGVAYDERLALFGFARYLGGHAAYQALNAARPGAILCSNDHLAIGCCAAAVSHGCRVPEDLSIIGMDNTMATKHNTPQITTVDQDVESIASGALSMLFTDMARAGARRDVPARHIDLEPELIIRASCAPPAEGRA